MENLTNKEVVRRFFDIYNAKNYEAAHQYIASNYIDHGLPQVRSVENAIEVLQSTHRSFPDIQVAIDELIEENGFVVFRGHFTGTHSGEFVGVPASGARIDFEALEIFKVENQQITESWGYWPLWQIMEQIQHSAKR
jgi:steroid delta-isomerase-like uncharacterized protein